MLNGSRRACHDVKINLRVEVRTRLSVADDTQTPAVLSAIVRAPRVHKNL
jgi:hypothetical protein